MHRTLTLTLLASLAACAPPPHCPPPPAPIAAPAPAPAPAPPPPVVVAAVAPVSTVETTSEPALPVPRPALQVVVHQTVGYDAKQAAFAAAAAQRLAAVLSSKELRDEVLKGDFRETGGDTPAQVYNAILTAHEEAEGAGKDGVVDLRLRVITAEDGRRWLKNCKLDSWAGTIGMDGGGDGITATCKERVKLWTDENDVASMAGHMMHEYLHQLGYTHDRRPKRASAVYRIGNIVDRLIRAGVGGAP